MTNIATMKTMLTIAAILMAAALTGLFSTSAFAYDGGDESETNTQQVLKQKNVGSGESTNFNCGENNIDTLLPIQACGTIDLGGEVTDDFTAPTIDVPSTP
jgi:hypothetical protein